MTLHAGPRRALMPERERVDRAAGVSPRPRRRARAVVGLLVLAGICLLAVAWMWRPQPPTGLTVVDGELEVPAVVPVEASDPVLAGPTEMPNGDAAGGGDVDGNDRGVDSVVAGPRVEIPAVGIAAGVGADLQVGRHGEWVPPLHELGRWPSSAELDDPAGGVMFAGHVWVGDQPGVLLRLRDVQVGNLIVVVGADGGREEFLVSSLRQFPRDALPATAWGDRAGARRLVLVTCAGRATTVEGRRVWSENLVVEAVPRQRA